MELAIEPGSEGIWFSLNGDKWEAIPENVTSTERCTVLGQVSTIEHLMSAFAGLGVTDAEVTVSSSEMPALGGGSAEYVSAIEGAGFTDIGSLEVTGPFARVFEKDKHTIAISVGNGHWGYTFDTGERWPGTQTFEFLPGSDYAQEIAPARTFCFEEELEWIKQAGLGKGLDETTALVLGKEGYVNEAKFPDEPARHKLLDLIGDLYLSGVPIQAINVQAELSGHTANVRAAQKLKDAVKIVRSD